MFTKYDFNKIKFATDEATFKRAVGLYESGKVTEVEALGGYYSAVIKPYRGPSRTWFANQDSLREGCNRLSAIVSRLSVNRQAAEILIKLLLRLDRKLRVGGVDDSNGIVGGFMSEVVRMLEEFAQIDPDCIDAFELLVGIGITCFQWEEPLIRILDERNS